MIYYLLSILTGVLIAAMVAVNGELTMDTGTYVATVIIHVVGLVFISIVCLVRREKPLAKRRLPWALYLGGVIGVGTTVFNNLAFGRISLSAIVALSLLGQSVTSLLIDQFGLFGMPRRAFRATKLSGLLFMLVGVTYMLWGTAFVAMPVIVSLLAGVSVVTSRSVNARLAERSSELVSTWFNYVVGLGVSAVVLLLIGRAELTGLALSSRAWVYLGGVIGVFVVLLLNVLVARVSAFYMTLLSFVGQVFAGIVIDALAAQAVSQANLVGGALVAVGMALNLWLDTRQRA